MQLRCEKMKILNRKVQLFCLSNIVVSFACTGLCGVTYCNNLEETVLEKTTMEVASTDLEPASQLGEKENKTIEEAKTTTKPVVENKNTTNKVTKVVTKKEVKAEKTYTPAVYSEVTGSAVVDYARKYLGLRYVSGGNSLSTGTDCSGFTKLIYNEFGITLSRVVSGQKNSGTYVSKSDLRKGDFIGSGNNGAVFKGDLVFYGSSSRKATHVAIYIGNGQVIHESNHRDGVKISSVNMMTYITARRVINSTAIAIVENKIKEESVKEESLEKSDNTVINNDTSINNSELPNSNEESISNNVVDDKSRCNCY